MLCATPFLERIQTCERECEDGTRAVLQFTEKEFGSMLTLRSPIVASQSHDEVIQMRTTNTATEQDIALKELEIQALRTAILQKHADLVRIKDEKVIKVNHADSLLRGMNRNTYLPVEVILRIFELLHYPQSVDYKIRSTRELSLYKIATGFEDLPGWRKAIMSQIPLVLAPDSRQWDNVKNELSLRNKIALGYHPRVCAYNDNDVIAQTGIREPSAAYLAINSGYFHAHQDVARHFQLKSVIFSASDLQKLSEGLDYAGELLWRIESLEIVLSRSYMEIHDGFWNQLGGQDNRGPFRLSIPPGDLVPRLRIACLPWGALQGCLPLLTQVTSLEIVIPEETDAIAVNNILVSLHSLPQSITHLTLRRVYSRDESPIFDDVDNNPAFLPNLVELAVKGFESPRHFYKGDDGGFSE
ncbi:hypothetical protein SCHPADRAFT_487924 [Schizopora paradoxa]|uniref:Uncharacterized protein n=1 Tax=Schizopora paradoxa TaxID=27342 RepID=A0A0H2RNP0_9AGAM|nr:hypothetical protein SCHPADRAFT_487924 [Schizopora paradoxa]